MSTDEPPLTLDLAHPATRGGSTLTVRLPEHLGVSLRLLQRLQAPGGGVVYAETQAGSWDQRVAAERRLEIPRLAPSWTGPDVEVAYVLSAQTSAGQSASCPLQLVPARPPADDADAPTAAQRGWQGLQADRKRLSCILSIPALALLVLASFGAAVAPLLTLLGTGQVTVGSLFMSAFGVGFGILIVVGALRQWRNSRARLGLVEPPSAALSGELHARAFAPVTWSLELIARWPVPVELDGTLRPFATSRKFATGAAGAGPFTVPINNTWPASVGSYHAGLSWELVLHESHREQRIPVTILPWFSAEAEARIRDSTAG